MLKKCVVVDDNDDKYWPYKTAVYTRANGDMQKVTHLKRSKIMRL